MIIQPIVEGHAEVEAVPVLVRRLRDTAQAFPLEVNPPIRRHRHEFFDEALVHKAVRLAIKQDCHALLLIVDGADQPALSAVFDLRAAYRKCRSFRHLVKVFGELAAAAGTAPQVDWPPSDWLETDAG